MDACSDFAIQCLYLGNKLIVAAKEEQPIVDAPNKTARPRKRMEASAPTYRHLKTLEALDDLTRLLDRKPRQFTNELKSISLNRAKLGQMPLSHDGMNALSAHYLAWSFAHRLWLGAKLAIDDGEFLLGKGIPGPPPSFALDDAAGRRHEAAIIASLTRRLVINDGQLAAVIQLEALSHGTPASDEAEFLGDGQYRVGSRELQLTGAQADVMQALVEKRSATKGQLNAASGIENSPRVLRKIRQSIPELAPYIKMPGARGRGGYSTTIVQPTGEA